MNSVRLRKLFIDFFAKKGHQVVCSSSLIPANDPTLLFTNAGMVQFKDIFLGLERRSYSRAVSVQRCLRAGGKHNDLEQVGHTARHHTFFEMLGNFSFGDYFKKEAIHYAWDFLTDILKLPPERLYITVYQDDKESESIWLREIKIESKRFARCGKKDNFWQMGDIGPCGPCTEIFYDHGEHIEGDPPGSTNQKGDRYVELWNIVFMQYERNVQGELTTLPTPCVDTGMGLERLEAVMQGVSDNYDIHLFQELLRTLSSLVGCYDFQNPAMRVIVDHIRSCSFLISDGILPSSEGRGYVLRRLIRRAVRYAYKLGQNNLFFYHLASPLIKHMCEAYPELLDAQSTIERILKAEEIKFFNTISKGMDILNEHIKHKHLIAKKIPGHIVFQLYDTYGFPPELTADIASEQDLTIDYVGFQMAMKQQRKQSQKAQHFNESAHIQKLHIVGKTHFVGYESLTANATITAVLQDNKLVEHLSVGESAAVILDRSPFYAESGGQIGDSGYLYLTNDGRFRVTNTKPYSNVYLHYGKLIKGKLQNNKPVHAEVDSVAHKAIMLNHSATHLLHEALRRVLGEHVRQRGSLIEVKRLRFDFSHLQALTTEELQAVERLVNQKIRENLSAETFIMSPQEAQKKGALALFGERYGKSVRVLKIGNFSTEICGGTHVRRSGDIGLLKIISESSCASGIRRIEAATGEAALRFVENLEEQLQTIAYLLKTHPNNIQTKITRCLTQERNLEKALTKFRQRAAKQQLQNLITQVVNIHGINVLATELEEYHTTNNMRDLFDQLKQQLGTVAIVFSSVHNNKIHMVAGVTKNCLSYFNATELLNQVAHQVGGYGGGRPEFAQGGGNHPKLLSAALETVFDWVKKATLLTGNK